MAIAGLALVLGAAIPTAEYMLDLREGGNGFLGDSFTL